MAGKSGAAASPLHETEVQLAAWLATRAGGGHATGPAAGGARLDLLRLLGRPAASLASASGVSEGESYPVPSCRVAAVSCLQFDSLLWGWKEGSLALLLPSTIPPLGAMGEPQLLWGGGARKGLRRSIKQALEKWIKQ